jgi:uncharacterized protein (TIGR00288 family)
LKTFAILIDAGFAKSKLGSATNPVEAADFQALVEKIRAHELLADKYLYRVYYYDAPPFSKTKNRPLNGGPHAFGSDPLTIHNFKLLRELKTIDYFALRMGEVRFRGWELDQKNIPKSQAEHQITADDFRPSLQQKGVDMRIGLDIASLTLKRQVDMLVLVTGDADFVPPMKFARREGVQFVLVALGHDVHQDLLEHADFSITLEN